MAGWSNGCISPCDIAEPTLSSRSALLLPSWRPLRDSGLLCGVRTSCRRDWYIPSRGRASHPSISRLIIVIAATFVRARRPHSLLLSRCSRDALSTREPFCVTCLTRQRERDTKISRLRPLAILFEPRRKTNTVSAIFTKVQCQVPIV